MTTPQGHKEFVAMMALAMSMVALAIDSMLPALSQIGDSLNVARDNDRQLVLTILFGGLAIGQIFYGPISDALGRRSPLYFGFVLFIIGCLMSALATSYSMLLIGRFLQGLGAAGPRIITVAIIRDQYAGREMARLMSLIMMVFILVPAIAPALGQGILFFADWRWIFLALMGLSAGTLIWLFLRQPETLQPADRNAFSVAHLWHATIEICTTRVAVVYTLCAGLIFGAFVGFLSSSQQILQEHYGLGDRFPAYFAILALTIGCASWLNSKLVMKLGMGLLCNISLWAIVSVSALFLLVCLSLSPPLWATMLYLVLIFFPTGILFGNFNSLAMEPLGHIAGLASSLIGSATTFISLGLGFLIGNAYNFTVIPLVSGFTILSLMSLILISCFSNREVPEL